MELKRVIKKQLKKFSPPPIINLLVGIRKVYWTLRGKYADFKFQRFKRKQPQQYAGMLYRQTYGYDVDWENPRDLDEKILYLEFCTDTSDWVIYADKYRVREFVKERGCEKILIPLYAKFNSPEEIRFDNLPVSFVMKMNNGCGDAIIVHDKNKINIPDTIRMITNSYNTKYGIESAEPHYLRIKPCIIVEKLLEQTSGSIVDYKVWCFNGVPYCIFTGINRDIAKNTVDFNLFDVNWNSMKDCISERFRNDVYVPRPTHLQEMLTYARKLSNGIPQVRLDFYEIDGHIYFGEMTMSSATGRMVYFTKEFLKEMGNQVRL